jgi:hypothetical protein
MHRKLYSCEAFLDRLTQDLQNMAAELGQLIQKKHAMVGQGHFARHRHVAPTDQPYIRNRAVGGAKRACHNQRRATAGEASDTVDGVVSMASAKVISGRMVVSCRTSIDVPAPGGRAVVYPIGYDCG